jgi:CrcB protein
LRIYRKRLIIASIPTVFAGSTHIEQTMTKWLFIAIGGSIGSVLRYALHTAVQRISGSQFPLGTLVVNVLGCLIIGFLAAAFSGQVQVREEVRLGLLVGLLGGFTTFSTFGIETFVLLDLGQLSLALLNIVLSCGLGILAVWLGFRVGGQWFAD